VFGPCGNAAPHIAGRREAMRTQILGHIAAAAAVMAEDKDAAVAGQFAEPPGYFPHRDVFAGFDPADLHLVRLPDVEHQDAAGLRLQQVAGFLNRDFERRLLRTLPRASRGGRRAREIIVRGVDLPDARLAAAQRTAGIALEIQSAKLLGECVENEQAPAQGLADAEQVFDRLHGLQAADHAAERPEDTGLAAVGHAPGRRWFGEETTVARASLRRVKHRHLALELENAAVNERPAGEKRRVVVQIARGKIVRAVDDEVIFGKQGERVGRRDTLAVKPQPHMRVQGGELMRRRFDLGQADGGGAVDDLPLEVVLLDPIAVRQAERAHTRGGQVERRGAAQAARADDEHACCRQLALTLDPDLVELYLPTVAAEFGGREIGPGVGHGGNAVKCVETPVFATAFAPRRTARRRFLLSHGASIRRDSCGRQRRAVLAAEPPAPPQTIAPHHRRSADAAADTGAGPAGGAGGTRSRAHQCRPGGGRAADLSDPAAREHHCRAGGPRFRPGGGTRGSTGCGA